MIHSPNQNQPDDRDEMTAADDAVIGRAFRYSFVAFAVLAVAAVVVLWYLRRKPAAGPDKITALAAPAARETPTASPPQAVFRDITGEAGIEFVHNNGAAGEKLLPETMGSGAAFFDFDNDGDQDLLLVNGTAWPGKPALPGRTATQKLYRNDGRGRFSDATPGSGLDVVLYGMGVAVGDADNDGYADVAITAVGGCRLFRNDKGLRFVDVTTRAGVSGQPTDWSTAAAWFDFDNDGDLDLMVANYVRWTREIDFEVDYTLVGVGRAYGPPMNFEGAFPYLYRNDGEFHFKEIGSESGLQVRNQATGVPVAKTLGIAPVDINQDGFIDLVTANDTTQNAVFLNTGKGTFREIGAASGIAFDSYGNTRGAMGIDSAYYRNDSALAIAIGNFANEMTALYVASTQHPTLFTDEAIPDGIGPASRLALKFGLFFFDYDLDGWLDVLTANGHLEEDINKVQQSQQYRQPAQLFWNSGGATLGGGLIAVNSAASGTDLFKPMVGRGSAYADIDGDGDLDVLLTQTGGSPLLLRNDQALGHHWIRLKLKGNRSNADGIGAWITVKVGAQTLRRQVMPSKSYLSQSELPVTIGLGSSAKVDAVQVTWPGGSVQPVTDLKIDELTLVLQGEAAISAPR